MEAGSVPGQQERGQWTRMLANMRGFFASMAQDASDGHVLELEGVLAAVVPSCPERSIVNCVIYPDPGALEAARDALADEYEQAGVRAWTVWVPEEDTRAAALLGRRGHVLDGRPTAMARELRGFESPLPVPELLEPDMATALRINDLAYGFAGDLERAFQRVPPEPARLYLAAVDGAPACTVLTYDSPDGDCGIYLVATLAEARGRGLATALMGHALTEASRRGCLTTSLQATARGRPLYERLGYRNIGAVHMWERRKREGGAG